MNKLIEISKRRQQNTPDAFRRFLLQEIDFTQKLIGIKGARGTGKTTLLLQKMKQLPSEETLYVSMDNIYFTSNTLVDLAENFQRNGGKYFFVDEVHKYANWSQELKNIYDDFPDLKVVFTSSSALEIHKAKHDLSRRALIYDLPGLSFREFLGLKYQINLPVLSLDEILSAQDKYITEIVSTLKPFKYFAEYLRSGYYPYFLEDEANYLQRLSETVNVVLETDLPAIYNINYSSVVKLKKLLYIIGMLVPYTPNLNKLSQQVETTRDSLLKFLYLLHNAHILKWLSKDAWGINFMNKPDKLYLENTNLAHALSQQQIDVGNMRETFFLNQVSYKHKVTYPEKGDFIIDNKYTIEIGGKNKTRKQIAGIDNSFLALDDIEYGHQNKIPLWLFGFLY